MAKATYTCTSCGGTAVVEAHSSVAAQSKAEWLGSHGGECKACYIAAKREDAAAKTAAAIDATEALSPAALTGSDKQVAWATKIRAGKLQGVRSFLDAAASKAADASVARATADKLIGALAAVDGASWWIDRRDLSDRDLITAGLGLAGLA